MKVLVTDFFGVVVREMLPPFFKAHIKDPEEAMRIKLSYSDPADVGEYDFLEELHRISLDMGMPEKVILEECLGHSTPIEKTIDFLRNCPHPIVLLSNAPEGLVEMLLSRYELESLFPRRVISYQERMKKPDRRIYEKVYRYFGEGQQYLFIDDNKANLVEPSKMGWETLLFEEKEAVFEALNKWAD